MWPLSQAYSTSRVRVKTDIMSKVLLTVAKLLYTKSVPSLVIKDFLAPAWKAPIRLINTSRIANGELQGPQKKASCICSFALLTYPYAPGVRIVKNRVVDELLAA